MKLKERRQKIVEYVNDFETVSIEFLIGKFNVSDMTIYRDLQILESEGYLKKTTGGAIKVNDFLVQSESPFVKRLKVNHREKIAIAEKAVELISNGDSIIIDAGTTSFLLVKEINKTKLSDMTVITNNIVAQIELSKNKNIEIIATGGTVREGSFSTVGVVTEKILNEIMVDKAFITTKGITSDLMIVDPNMYEGRIKELYTRIARKKILIADSSKFGVMGLYQFGSLKDFDVIITDSNISDKNLKVLKKTDLKVEIAEV
jgi:DeoR family fructose operon transcriptional repressor